MSDAGLTPSAQVAGPGSASTQVSASLRRLAAGACLASASGLFLLPFLWPWHTLPLVTFYNEWIAAVLVIVALFAAALGATRGQGSTVELPAVTPLFLPLFAVILLQWALGRLIYSSDAMLPMMTLALATVALVLGHMLARDIGLPRMLLWFAIAAVSGALLNIAVQVLQLLSAHGIRIPYLSFHSDGQYFGVLAQRNHLATYLSWGLVGALYLHVRRKIGPRSLLALVLVLLAGSSLTLSRTGMLQVFWIAIAAAAMTRAMAPEARPAHWQWVLGLPVLYVAISTALPHVLELMSLSISGSAIQRAATEGVDGPRMLLFSQGVQLFLENPLFGIGPGQLFFEQFRLLDEAKSTLYASSTHNIVLDLFVMTGMLGALPFLLLAGAWALRVLPQSVNIERAAALLMLSVLAIHAMLELPHWYAFFLLPAALLLGALDIKVMPMPAGRLLRLLPLVLCLYGVLVSASMWAQYRELERLFVLYHTKARNPAAANEKGLAELLAYQRTTWFTGSAEYLVFTNIALNDRALADKLAIGARTIRHQPEPHVVYRYALLLALDGKQQEALTLLERTRKVFPKAYDEIAAEFVDLAQKQPELFGNLGHALHK